MKFNLEWEPTERQLKIIKLACDARSEAQIGAVVGCTAKNVARTLQGIYLTLGFHTGEKSNPGACRLKLFRWALKNKIVTL